MDQYLFYVAERLSLACPCMYYLNDLSIHFNGVLFLICEMFITYNLIFKCIQSNHLNQCQESFGMKK